ncbi:MAG: HlyD family efflux transporter periplasmic adaptor subunit [Balneolaceae bacterium]
MNNQLFPEEIIENSQEANFSKHSVSSHVIYIIILLFLIGAISVTPLIYVDVGVRSQGLIRPVTNLIQLASPVAGRIEQLQIKENSFIEQGEIAAVLEAPQIREQLRFIESRQHQLSSYLNDLNLFQEGDSLSHIEPVKLQSPRYQRSLIQFRQQLINQKQNVEQAENLFNREQILFNRNASSKAALDEVRFSYQSEKNQYELLTDQQLNEWKLDEITYQNELEELQSEVARLQQELNLYEIRSPISGTVQNLSGIFQGSFLNVNQVLAEVSPDTALMAEAYVFPRDIGLLYEGMAVRFQIDSYNYNQWGVATGTISSISRDVIMNDDQPVFRVRCKLNQVALDLPNGYKGDIKKGMTFQARFIVNRRSLFQLLFDKVDDWLNPSWGENNFDAL